MKKDEFITITNEDIYKTLHEVKEMAEKTLVQACKTNGRVTNLEKRSLGMWVARHPFKFTLIVIVVISLLTAETREALFNYAQRLL
jgi:hypothetical protein